MAKPPARPVPGSTDEAIRNRDLDRADEDAVVEQTDTQDGAVKDPNTWVTGDEPMTGAQKSYLTTLSNKVGEEPPAEDLTKAEASIRIEELRDEAGVSTPTKTTTGVANPPGRRRPGATPKKGTKTGSPARHGTPEAGTDPNAEDEDDGEE